MEEPTVKTHRSRIHRVMIEALAVDDVDALLPLNRLLFSEERLINSFAREDLRIWVARHEEAIIGFKIGYRESRNVFYSAKGGVHPEYRRRGIARDLLHVMADAAAEAGYRRLAFDTFPNRHPGMAVMAFEEGFRLARADFNPTYRDYRLRFELDLRDRSKDQP
jgi:GNAT superfamily N-acetyltransferase